MAAVLVGCSPNNATVANPASMVGTWTGRPEPITPPAAFVDEQTRKREEGAAAMLNNVRVEFEFHKDGTCLMDMPGLQLPGTPSPDHRAARVPGAWTLVGNKLNLTFLSEKGKVADFTVSPDGKSFSHGNRGATFTKE